MTTAYILFIGQKTFNDCVDSVRDQVDSFSVIKYVHPVNKAINKCFKYTEGMMINDFLILGADTILYPNAIKTMKKYRKSNLWCVFGRLEDYYRGNDGCGNHLYHTKAMHGVRVSENDPMYDHKIHSEMEKRGFKKAVTKEIIGKHHPIWTPREAFEKHYHSGQRYEEKELDIYYEMVKKKYEENDCSVNRAALDGFRMGMKFRKPEALDYKRKTPWAIYRDKYNNEEILEW